MSSTSDNRPCSIDLTLELERQLDNESLPPDTPGDLKRPQSLDPQVIAHIITDLRSTLADTTRHRDELAKTLADIQEREKDLTDTLAYMTDKCSELQVQLDTAANKAQDDENTISLLRTKVEESRYVPSVPCAPRLPTFTPGADSCVSSPRVGGRARCRRRSTFPELVLGHWVAALRHRSGRRSRPALPG